MELILLQDVEKLGFKDEIVNVKNGYGRNYLIPGGHAILATDSARKVLAENLRQRAKKENKIIEGVFRGETLNTPSMLCVEDYLDVLNWVEKIGGLSSCIARANKSLYNIESWIEKSDFFDFLCDRAESRSNTSVCLCLLYTSPSPRDRG